MTAKQTLKANGYRAGRMCFNCKWRKSGGLDCKIVGEYVLPTNTCDKHKFKNGK